MLARLLGESQDGAENLTTANLLDEFMCGVIGVLGPHSDQHPNWASYEAYRGLLTLQHRGQDAAGLLTYDQMSNRFYSEKDLGLISHVFDQKKLDNLRGSMAIAHTRYATVGTNGRADLQPLATGFPLGIGLIHNGNLLNYHSLAKKLVDENGLQLLTSNDLEVLMHLWCQKLNDLGGEFTFSTGVKAAESISLQANGAYALVGLVAGKGLFGLRDPGGIRPLVLGKKENEKGKVSYCLASETVALNFLGYELVRDIAPGEFIFIDLEGKIRSAVVGQGEQKHSPCMFEWIYFSGAESIIEGKSVYASRLRLGHVLGHQARKLIEKNEITPDMVCPVPDTSRTAAIALAESLGLPYREGLIKNRYIQRSFILNSQEKREKAVELKLSPVRSEIEGKSILLVDDSVVRGTTSKKIIQLLKRYGAKDITLAITCPPIRYGCFYGIDFPDAHDLIANDKTVDEIADWVGANRVLYLSEEDVKEAIQLKDMCMACINNNYPTSVREGEEFAEKRRQAREYL